VEFRDNKLSVILAFLSYKNMLAVNPKLHKNLHLFISFWCMLPEVFPKFSRKLTILNLILPCDVTAA
jgi:hypothetical protein